ncbi:MAG: CHC2 zinc finger domain-containing protein, partial [Bacteroidales bacterium]|nr:CHC2 zinc finger domain-containing protein [Bacteroidales bacterium]
MPRFDYRTIENIKETARIEDVVSDFVELHRSGSSLKACCPFHNEKTPSFVVTPSRQMYKCFGCGESGDVIKFVQKIKPCSFTEAIIYLANKYHIPIEERPVTPEDIAWQQKRESALQIMSFAADWTKEQLNKGLSTEASNFLFNQLAVEESQVEKFNIGFWPSSESSDLFLHALQQKGFDLAVATELGLLVDGNHDAYSNTIIVPMKNSARNTIALIPLEIDAQQNRNTLKKSLLYDPNKSIFGRYEIQRTRPSTDFIFVHT